MYNVTRERIRQIEAKALRKLRHPTRVRHLQGFLDTEEAFVEALGWPVETVDGAETELATGEEGRVLKLTLT